MHTDRGRERAVARGERGRIARGVRRIAVAPVRDDTWNQQDDRHIRSVRETARLDERAPRPFVGCGDNVQAVWEDHTSTVENRG